MKNKIFILIGIILIIAFTGCTPEEPRKTTFEIPYDFEYTKSVDELPDEYMVGLELDFICDNGEDPNEYPFYKSHGPKCTKDITGCGGIITRTAYKCDNEYYIGEIMPPLNGPYEVFYGPFYLEEKPL